MEFIKIIVYFSIYLGLVTTSFFILSFFENKKKEKIPLIPNKKLPFVSVIIPAYNEEEGIIKTIKSALEADYPKNKIEILVIDDGSKDKTLKLAKSIKNPIVKVFSKSNEGKASALNFGISKARGEIIFTMDADTMISNQSIINMVQFFQEKDVMAVNPLMITIKPKTIAQRIQYVEYIMGLFLRKVFSGLNSIYVSPGAFSAYRKSFFEKYGGYKVGDITEDLEMSLRIQSKNFKIKNCPDAIAYTAAPKTFKELLIQRRRWYVGLIKNTFSYKHLISKKYGDLGLFVFPLSWITTILSVIVTISMVLKTIINTKKEILFLKTINFDLGNIFQFNFLVFEKFIFLLISDPIFWFIFIFIILYAIYMRYAEKKIGEIDGLLLNLPIFFLFFSICYGFWWINSIIYSIFSKKIKWR
jgi:cellulose synthase/poly-beta-1,6-N-acetylglucosamine synthase-like glycosyltransferase